MQPGKEISDELKGLGSYLADLNRSVPFVIPEGYFNDNIAVIMQGVGADDSDTDIPIFISRTNPYLIPQGYFEGFAAKMLNQVLEVNSTLLPQHGVHTLAAPEGYFNQLPERVLAAAKADEKPAARVIPLGSTLWKNLRWAAAAILIAGIGFGGYQMTQSGPAKPLPAAKSVEQRLAQIPETTISNYIQQNIDDFDGDMLSSFVANNENAPLTKDQLTDKEIIDYLDETGWETSL